MGWKLFQRKKWRFCYTYYSSAWFWKEEKYRKLQGTYPVIKVSFADIKSTNYESAKQAINRLLVELYNENYFLLENDLLSEVQRFLVIIFMFIIHGRC